MFTSPVCASMAEIRGELTDQFNLARLELSVAAGRAVFDGTLAGACLDGLRRLSCPNWAAAGVGQQAAVPDACRRMIQGTRPRGRGLHAELRA